MQLIPMATHSRVENENRIVCPCECKRLLICFTEANQDGDTWTLNGAALTVTYHDGQALLATAVIAGDMVEAIIQGDTMRLLLQKPTPQPNLLINGLFDTEHVTNQRRQSSYSGTYIYTIDLYHISNGTLKLVDNGLEIDPAPQAAMDFYQQIHKQDEWAGKLFTFSAEIDGSLYTLSSAFGAGATNFDWGQLHLFSDQNDTSKRTLPIIRPFRKVIVSRVKLEPGPRFTGWYEPKPVETLTECRRYQECIPLYRVSFGPIINGHTQSSAVVLGATKRIRPVVTVEKIDIPHYDNYVWNDSEMSVIADNEQNFVLDFTGSCATLVENKTVTLINTFVDANL